MEVTYNIPHVVIGKSHGQTRLQLVRKNNLQGWEVDISEQLNTTFHLSLNYHLCLDVSTTFDISNIVLLSADPIFHGLLLIHLDGLSVPRIYRFKKIELILTIISNFLFILSLLSFILGCTFQSWNFLVALPFLTISVCTSIQLLESTPLPAPENIFHSFTHSYYLFSGLIALCLAHTIALASILTLWQLYPLLYRQRIDHSTYLFRNLQFTFLWNLIALLDMTLVRQPAFPNFSSIAHLQYFPLEHTFLSVFFILFLFF